jgi:DNA polymerase III epsilon subunit-like protein
VAWLRPLWSRRRGHTMPLDALVRRGFIAIDLETTGLDSRVDVPVAAAVIPIVAGQPRPGYVTLVNPARTIPPTAVAVHGITDVMVQDAPRIDEALRHIDLVCEAYPIVGHGVAFDMAILGRERRRHGQPLPTNAVLCTMRLAAALHPDWVDVGLDTVAARLGFSVAGRHTAEGDALAAAHIFLALLPAARQRGARTLADLQWLQATATV